MQLAVYLYIYLLSVICIVMHSRPRLYHSPINDPYRDGMNCPRLFEGRLA